MPQPYPDPSGINSSTTVVQHANTITNGWFGNLMVISLFIVCLTILLSKKQRLSDSLLGSFFITFTLSALLFPIGLIQGKIVVLVLLLTVASGLYSYLDN